jgi:hypothetical protein
MAIFIYFTPEKAHMLNSNITYAIDKLIPVFAVFTAWFLGFTNQQYTFNRQDKIKLKRLLFNLMELRYWIQKELHLDKQMKEILDLFFVEMLKHIPFPADQMPGIKQMMLGIIRKQFLLQPKLPDLESSIETIVKELAEVDPVFAFELTGKFHVTEKISAIQSYLAQVDAPQGDDPSEKDRIMELVLRPQMMGEVVRQLDEHILDIARKISRNMLNQVKAMVYSPDEGIDKEQTMAFLNEYIPRLLEHAPPPEN